VSRKRRKTQDEDATEGSHRICAATRTEHEPAELIRFVAGPSGEIVPDLARRLPGRGIWISCEKSVLEAAIRANVFAKALKRQVKVPDNLPGTIEVMLAKRVAEAFAIANKAGLVTTGFAQVEAVIESGTARVLVHGSEAAPGGREKLDRKFAAIARESGRTAEIVTTLSTEELSLAMGRSNVVHAALIQGGATDRLLSEAERLMRFRSGSVASRSARAPGT
jgi:predicted RNA-binding protein YlxR (DUF448 family)